MKAVSSMGELQRNISKADFQMAAFELMLIKEAERLRSCIQRHLDIYYATYEPKVYPRTFALQKSLKVNKKVDVLADGKTFQVTVYFDDAAVLQKNQFSGNIVNTANLINYGWSVKKNVWFKDVYRFGYYEGYGFVEKGIADYNRNNPHNIKITIRNPNR